MHHSVLVMQTLPTLLSYSHSQNFVTIAGALVPSAFFFFFQTVVTCVHKFEESLVLSLLEVFLLLIVSHCLLSTA